MSCLQPFAAAVVEFSPAKFCWAMAWLESVYQQCVSVEWELSLADGDMLDTASQGHQATATAVADDSEDDMSADDDGLMVVQIHHQPLATVMPDDTIAAAPKARDDMSADDDGLTADAATSGHAVDNPQPLPEPWCCVRHKGKPPTCLVPLDRGYSTGK